MNQTKITTHGKERAKQRKKIKNPHSLEKCIRLALERGRSIEDFKGQEKEYLLSKQNIKVIVYDGFCFLFSDKNTYITLYPLPKWFEHKKHYNGKESIRNIKKYHRYYDLHN